MIHKRFKNGAEDILSYTYSKSAGVFTLRLKNNAIIHYEAKSAEVFLQWLTDNQVPEQNKLKPTYNFLEGSL